MKRTTKRIITTSSVLVAILMLLCAGVKLGCEYISDMRSCRALLTDAKKVVSTLDLEAYTARELADMAEYLYGKKMYGADKEVIISFLKQAL